MKAERIARLFVLGVALGVPLAALLARWARAGAEPRSIEMHGRMAETGGWTPDALRVPVGEPLVLRLTSDDVMHGFAIGQDDWAGVDVKPGQVTEAWLTFEQPGTYTFYCTRWCGPNHWRMRGTIEVVGQPTAEPEAAPPLYVRLGLDLDAPHPAGVTPARTPSAARGGQLDFEIPEAMRSQAYYRSHSPVDAFLDLRRAVKPFEIAEDELWDLVASVWRSNTTPESLAEGKRLYAQNCAACHGVTGGGDGVMAVSLETRATSGSAHGITSPVDFTDPASMLGASPALLQGKIVRGGMGTGMPYWGPIFTEAQTWALVGYLWTFQMDDLEGTSPP